jgi:hypothetical protein
MLHWGIVHRVYNGSISYSPPNNKYDLLNTILLWLSGAYKLITPLSKSTSTIKLETLKNLNSWLFRILETNAVTGKNILNLNSYVLEL